MLPLIAVKNCWVSVIPRKVMVMKKRGRGGRIGSSEGRSERVSDEWKQSPHWGCRNMAGNELMHIVSFCMSWPTWFNLFWRAGKRKSKRERERMKHKRDLLYIQIKNLNLMALTLLWWKLNLKCVHFKQNNNNRINLNVVHKPFFY